MDALQFIHAFTPIISKAAMQTYHSALLLMPSASLLSQKYCDSAISQPSGPSLRRKKSECSIADTINSNTTQSSSPLPLQMLTYSDSGYSQTINHSQVMLPECLYDDCTSSDDIIALSHKGGIAFFDTRTGNEINSRIPTPDCHHLIAFSPDGKWIAIQGDYKCALEIWDVKTCTCVKTIETKSEHVFEHITYSADGEKVMVVTIPTHYHFSVPHRLVFISDVKTDKPLKQLDVEAINVAISPDGSQIAINDKLGIKVIDVSTGHIGQQITPYKDILWTDPNPPIVWSPNGHFLASASVKNVKTVPVKQYKRAEIYLLPLTHGSAQVPSLGLTLPTRSTGKYAVDLACSPDSSKLVAVLWDYEAQRMTLYVCCARLALLAGLGTLLVTGTSSFESAMEDSAAALSFAVDGQDILICTYSSFSLQNSILHCFSVVPTYLEIYMNHPPKFHPFLSQTPHTIQYSHYISGAIDDYASHVDADGWILNLKGGREIWTPWANYELLCSCNPPQKGQTQYRTLEVMDPETKTIVLIYVIAFEQKEVNNRIQEAVASIE